MDKKEVLNLLLMKSERIQLVKDQKYGEAFPEQSHYVEIDGQRTRFYKCSMWTNSYLRTDLFLDTWWIHNSRFEEF